ncbi:MULTISPECIES: ABC transporter permease [unclassified Methanobrevibacter]|jgi:ABC-2 type transport system permease protein/bacitracin transport system permease protein|uniref:ABC transporter permease n=1 Tax=unclassified Methanobrevibacter TaxID=2638681 RepID=UPI00375AB1CF|nr:ABC transporter permease [Methanobacteriaceae archaeon]
MLTNFIEMEFLKLKRSKIFLVTLLGCLVIPFLLSGEFLYMQSQGNQLLFDLFLSESNLYFLSMFGVVLFAVIANHLFTREYNEHTLKSILTLPVSKTKYLTGKFSMYLLWILILSIFTFLSSSLCFILLGGDGFTWTIFFKMFKELIFGSILLYLAMSPLVFLSILMKNSVFIMIASAGIVFGNMLVYGKVFAPLFPWISPFIISAGKLGEYTYGTLTPSLIILATFIIGVFITWLYTYKSDVPL